MPKRTTLVSAGTAEPKAKKQRPADADRSASGKFIPGNKAKTRPTVGPAPLWMVQDGLEALWKKTGKEALAGDAQARKAIIEWKEKQHDRDRQQGAETADAIYRRAAEYRGLPDSVCDLLEELATGLGNVIDRAQLGLPLSASEELIWKYAQAFTKAGRRSDEARALEQIIQSALNEHDSNKSENNTNVEKQISSAV